MTDTRIVHKGRTIAANLTRPADTTAYAAGDVVADSTSAPTIITFPRATADALSYIQQATIVSSQNAATKPDLELWLFDTAITMDNDNAAFTPTDAELRTLLGVIAFPVASFKVGDAGAAAVGNVICDVQGLNIQINSTPTVNAIYGVLVVRNAYAPVSAERFDIRLKLRD